MRNAQYIREHITTAGAMRYCSLYIVRPVPGNHRKPKRAPSTETQTLLNERHRNLYLEQLIHANPELNRYVTLTCSEYDCDVEAEIKKFIARVKYRCKNAAESFKYIYVLQKGDKGGRPHCHMLCNAVLSRDEMDSLWTCGRCNSDAVQYNSDGITDLAKYIGRDCKSMQLGKVRWHRSRGLHEPEIKQRDGQISKKQVKSISVSADNGKLPDDLRTYVERRYEGTLIDCKVFNNELTGERIVHLKFADYDNPLFDKFYNRKRDRHGNIIPGNNSYESRHKEKQSADNCR